MPQRSKFSLCALGCDLGLDPAKYIDPAIPSVAEHPAVWHDPFGHRDRDENTRPVTYDDACKGATSHPHYDKWRTVDQNVLTNDILCAAAFLLPVCEAKNQHRAAPWERLVRI